MKIDEIHLSDNFIAPKQNGQGIAEPGNGMVTKYRKNGLLFLNLENPYISITILPDIGGKILEIKSKQSGTDFLLESPDEYSKTNLPYYGADYIQYGPSGFDDCFPTVAPSTYPVKGDIKKRIDIDFPDHGELWSIPWQYHTSGDSVYLHVKGVRFKYEFSKTIRLEKGTVHIEYRLINLSSVPFLYIWSAQPLMEVQPGSEIVLEEDVDQVLLDWTTDSKIGENGDRLPWPWLTSNRDTNYAIIPSSESNFAIKLYTDVSVTGTCSYVRSDTGEKLTFEFDPGKVPYVGILLCYIGLRKSTGHMGYTVALQPSSGRPDMLQRAYMGHEHSELEAFGMEEWDLRISLA